MNNILTYLDELYPNPKCELEYTKDYELLIAIVLSAQTTDKRVNIVNKTLFAKLNLSYKELKDKIDPFDPNRNKITFSSRYSGPKWEDDFIDLDALINNVVRDCVKDAKEVE